MYEVNIPLFVEALAFICGEDEKKFASVMSILEIQYEGQDSIIDYNDNGNHSDGNHRPTLRY